MSVRPHPLRRALGGLFVMIASGALTIGIAHRRGHRASWASAPAPRSAQQLFADLERLPILQQQEARQRATSQRVVWLAAVQDIEQRTDERQRDIYRLILQDPRNPEIRIEADGFTRADLKTLRELRRSQRIVVTGAIDEIQRDGVTLRDAKLSQTH